MPIHLPQGDLSRVISHDPENEWPDTIEIRARWKTAKGGNRYASIHITGDEFFGRTTGAPLSGDQVIGIINRLRRQKKRG